MASAAAASSPRRETAARSAQTRSKVRAETGSQARSKVWSKTGGVPWPVRFSGVGFTLGWRSDSFTTWQGGGKKETHLEQEYGHDERSLGKKKTPQNVDVIVHKTMRMWRNCFFFRRKWFIEDLPFSKNKVWRYTTVPTESDLSMYYSLKSPAGHYCHKIYVYISAFTQHLQRAANGSILS